jgi:voltage-gated potassium channel
MSLRQRIKFLLEDTETLSGKFTTLSLIILNFVFVLIYVLETYSLSEQAYSLLWSLEVLITVIFSVEYVARIYASKKGVSKIFEPMMVADFVAILPVALIFLGPGTAVSAGFLKVFRVFRVFRFFRITEDRSFLYGKFSESDLQIIKFITIIFAVFFVSAGFFHEVEVSENPDVDTFRDSMYYTVVTLTTVGFGDITPVTNAGKWVTIFSIMAGVILIPWQASRIVKAWNSQDKIEVTCPECGLKYHDSDASHCKACGHVIEQEYDSRDTEYL